MALDNYWCKQSKCNYTNHMMITFNFCAYQCWECMTYAYFEKSICISVNFIHLVTLRCKTTQSCKHIHISESRSIRIFQTRHVCLIATSCQVTNRRVNWITTDQESAVNLIQYVISLSIVSMMCLYPCY